MTTAWQASRPVDEPLAGAVVRAIPEQRPVDLGVPPSGEQLHRLLVESLPQSAVYLFDHQLRFLLAGGEAMRAAALPSEHVVGRLLSEVVAEDSYAVLEPLYLQALAGEAAEVDYPGEDRERWYRVRARPVRSDSGEVVAGLVVTDDITEQLSVKAALALSRERWRRLFEDAPVGMWLAEPGPDGRILDVNAALETMLDLPREVLLAARKVDIISPSAPDVFEAAAAALATDGGTTGFERRFVLPDGTVRVVEMSATLVDGPDGARTLGHFVDVTETRTAGERQRAAVEFLQAVLSVVPDPVHVSALDRGAHVWMSRDLDDAATTLLRRELVHPDDVHLLAASLADVAAAQDGEVVQVRHRVLSDDGSVRWLDRRKTPFRRAADGQVEQYASIVRDVTDEVTAHDQLAQALAFQEAVLATTPDLVLLIDASKGTPTWTSRSTQDLLGWSSEALAHLGDHAAQQLVHPDDEPAFVQGVQRALAAADGQVVEARYRARHVDGSWHWLSRRMLPFLRDADGTVERYLTVVRDVTELVEGEQRLGHAAMHDELTSLPNRRLVADRLAVAMTAASEGLLVAVLFLDLDGFKRVNDQHSHAAGDAVLKEVAARLRAAVREGDTVGRMGGDEFVVVLSDDDEERLGELAQQVAERLRVDIAEPVEHDGIGHVVTASIGIAYADGSADADALLRDADTAMYYAKSRGKDRVTRFHPDQRAEVQQPS